MMWAWPDSGHVFTSFSSRWWDGSISFKEQERDSRFVESELHVHHLERLEI